ncbi:MAG TPA: hypothetical protein VKB72_11140 [Steroidobacteraceae bacterium]|nr:hypothetical protein [Steroidobacteraceae bacterium]
MSVPAISVAMVIAFAVTIAITSWGQHSEESTVDSTARGQQAETTRSVGGGAQGASASIRPSTAGRPGADPAHAPSDDAPRLPRFAMSGETQPSDAPPALPVQLFFQHRMVHDDPQNPRKQSLVMQGRILNASSHPISVDLLLRNPALTGSSQLRIELGPTELRDFGFDDGLVMHPGDMVTVSGPGFRDLVVHITN